MQCVERVLKLGITWDGDKFNSFPQGKDAESNVGRAQ